MICFAWHGFPQYAARCVGAFVRATEERVVVIATRPHVPVEGMETLCGCEIVWIASDETRSLRELIGEMPRVLFLSGWGFTVFNRFRDQVRASSGTTIAMCDNDFRFSVKELVRAIRFRLFIRSKYDGFWVPGKLGLRLMRAYGVPAEKVRVGMYSADASIFHDGRPIVERPKKMLFVGQLIRRKNIVPFVKAFKSVAGCRDWQLEICGSGDLKNELLGLARENPSIVVRDFVQPEAVAALYREARVFVLPSIEEHWGLVAHEAALSGCLLLMSDRIAAGEDMKGDGNLVQFDPISADSMRIAIGRALAYTDEELERAQTESLNMARRISLELFVKNAQAFCRSGREGVGE